MPNPPLPTWRVVLLGVQLSAIVVAIALVTGHLTVPTLGGRVGTATPTSTASPRPTTRTAVPHATPTAAGTSASAVEGRDYQLQRYGGAILRWGCSTTIPVGLVGAVPDTEQADLEYAVAQVREASGLPLEVVAPDALTPRVPDLLPDGMVAGAITVRVAAKDQFRQQDPSAGEAVIGFGGLSTAGDGTAVAGRVVLLATSDWAVPVTENAPRLVLMHELGHAVGLDHASQESGQLMAPTLMPDMTGFGDGDRAGLRLIGCPR